jgi:hypothetical protein
MIRFMLTSMVAARIQWKQRATLPNRIATH